MKVLLINGSSRKECTYTALSKVAESLNEEGIETEIINLGGTPVRDCIGCKMCAKNGNARCVFNDDIVNEIIEKAEESDGFIFGTPVYYAHPSGRILSVLDRAFYAGKKAFEFKPGASIISARRGGTNNKEEVLQDLEGMQTMYNLGKNMAWILKCIESGKQNNINKPVNKTVKTNFIR